MKVTAILFLLVTLPTFAFATLDWPNPPASPPPIDRELGALPETVTSAAAREDLRVNSVDFHRIFLGDYHKRLQSFRDSLEEQRKHNDKLLAMQTISEAEYRENMNEYRRLFQEEYKTGEQQWENAIRSYQLRINRIARLRVVRSA